MDNTKNINLYSFIVSNYILEFIFGWCSNITIGLCQLYVLLLLLLINSGFNKSFKILNELGLSEFLIYLTYNLLNIIWF